MSLAAQRQTDAPASFRKTKHLQSNMDFCWYSYVILLNIDIYFFFFLGGGGLPIDPKLPSDHNCRLTRVQRLYLLRLLIVLAHAVDQTLSSTVYHITGLGVGSLEYGIRWNKGENRPWKKSIL